MFIEHLRNQVQGKQGLLKCSPVEPRGQGQPRQREGHTHWQESMTVQKELRNCPAITSFLKDCDSELGLEQDLLEQVCYSKRLPELSTSAQAYLIFQALCTCLFYRTNPICILSVGLCPLKQELAESTDGSPWGL